MKANEAPDKIYVSNHNSGLTYNWHNKRLAVKDIEYIRTDAFIEKAAEWLNNFYNEDTRSYLIDEDIENFINYMKGE